MSSITKYELWPTTDLANVINALDLAGAGFGGDFERGWRAALVALRVAVGVSAPAPAGITQAPAPVREPCSCGHSHAAPMILDVAPRRDDPEPPQRGPIKVNLFEGIEDVPWAIRAFANLK